MAVRVIEEKEWKEDTVMGGPIGKLFSNAYDTIHWTHRRDGKWAREVNGGICCGTFPSNKRDNTDALIVTLNGKWDTYKDWWLNVFDPNTSPWKRGIKNPIIYRGDTDIYGGCVYLEVDKDTGFRDMINMLIASRQSYEGHEYVKSLLTTVWPELKKEVPDITFAEALAIQTFMYNKRMHNQPVYYTGGHQFLNRYGGTCILRMAQCKPAIDDKNFRTSSDYIYSDMIWRDTSTASKWDAFLKEHDKPTVSTSKFSAYATIVNSYTGYGKGYSVPVPDLIKFLRETKVD